jgi:cell wall-associated NlpC family hydrolase
MRPLIIVAAVMLGSVAHADTLNGSSDQRKPIDYSRNHALSGQAGDAPPASSPLDGLLGSRGRYASDADAALQDDQVSSWLARQAPAASRDGSPSLQTAPTDNSPEGVDRFAALVIDALGHIGVPYKYGGNSVATGGFDCSGFVKAIYHEALGTILPRRSEEQAAATAKIAREELRPGDLVFFKTTRRAFSHVGIYIGDDKFVHAPRTGARIRLDDINSSYWTRRFNGARRVDVAQHQEDSGLGQPGLRLNY